MTQKDTNPLPKNAIEAQGQLIKAFYEKFGSEALPIVEKVLSRQGCALGQRIKKKIQDDKLSTIGKAFAKNFDPNLVEIISISDDRFHIRGTKCPFGLENTSKELCEAVMAIDREYFYTATNGRTRLQIKESVAAGDAYCDTIYSINKK